MKVFIDNESRCHTTNPDGTFREVESDFFNGKCQTLIEGYCYDDSKGYVQIYPWKNCKKLASAQQEYERNLLSQYKIENEEYLKALQILSVEI